MLDMINQSPIAVPILIAAVAVLFIMVLVMLITIVGLKKKYKAFTSTSNSVDIESVLISNQKSIDAINTHLQRNDSHIDSIYDNLKLTFEKFGMIKYDAFDGMGGQLSAVIVLMNKKHNGFLLNAIHTREGSHMYTKEIVNGKTEQALSKEEEAAIKKAMMNERLGIS